MQELWGGKAERIQNDGKREHIGPSDMELADDLINEKNSKGIKTMCKMSLTHQQVCQTHFR